jgi:hypothetical protein
MGRVVEGRGSARELGLGDGSGGRGAPQRDQVFALPIQGLASEERGDGIQIVVPESARGGGGGSGGVGSVRPPKVKLRGPDGATRMRKGRI